MARRLTHAHRGVHAPAGELGQRHHHRPAKWGRGLINPWPSAAMPARAALSPLQPALPTVDRASTLCAQNIGFPDRTASPPCDCPRLRASEPSCVARPHRPGVFPPTPAGGSLSALLPCARAGVTPGEIRTGVVGTRGFAHGVRPDAQAHGAPRARLRHRAGGGATGEAVVIGQRVILNTGAGCRNRYRTGVIEADTVSDLGASGKYVAYTVRLDRLPRERVEKRETVALIRGDELVRDKPQTRAKIADWLRDNEPGHRALGWL